MQNHNQIKTPNAYYCMLHDTSHSKEEMNQALSECAVWLALLDFLSEESYSLKTKLSEVLDNNTDRELVAEAENFHNHIIVRDEYIRDIAADTKSQERELRELFLKPEPGRQWIKPQQKLRNEIAYLENDFEKMKEDFYRKFLRRAAK